MRNRKGHVKHRNPSWLTEPATRISRLVKFALLFGASLMVANSFVGENGVMHVLKARRQHHLLVKDVAQLKLENYSLRQTSHRLRQNPDAVEEVARETLGLIKPGELVFLFTTEPYRPR